MRCIRKLLCFTGTVDIVVQAYSNFEPQLIDITTSAWAANSVFPQSQHIDSYV
jgi:hypothetical protein